MKLSNGNSQNYFSIKHDKETGILSFCMSQGISDDMFPIKEHFPIQFMSATREYKDIKTDDCFYPNCKVVSLKVNSDECDFIFEAAKTILRKNISDSINHIES